MTTAYFNLSSGNFSQNWSGTSGLLSTDSWAGIPSIMGYRGDNLTANTALDPQTNLADGDATPVNLINASAASSTTGGIHEINDDVVALQGSGTADAPHLVVHLDGTGRENIHFTATLRELDASTTDQKFAVQYRIGDTGDFINLPSSAISGVFQAAGNQTAAIDVTLPIGANNQSQIQVRIITNDAPGSDAMIGIDDIAVTSTAISGSGAGSFSVANVSVAEGDAGTTDMVFTVTRAGGSTGATTVDFATADGSATAGSDYGSHSGTLSFADGETSKTITVHVNGDTVAETAETLFLNLSNATGGATISDAQATGTISNDDFAVSYIHDVQGSAFFSPILAAEGISSFNVASAATVTVRAVVTAIDTFGTLQGFYISEETTDWDGSLHTSEGIFVQSSAVAGLTVGETVMVTAHVMEYQDFTNLNRTILTDVSSVVQFNDTQALPTFVIDGTDGHKIPTSIISDDNPVFTDSTGASGTFDPQNDALDFYETLEGMRVTMTDMVVADGFVGGSDNFVYFNAYSADNADPSLINSRGGYTSYGDPALYPEDTATTADDVKYGGSTVHDGATHGDIIELDFGNVGRGGTSSFDQDLTMGDSLGDVTGILDFDFGVAKLYVTDALDAAKVAALDDTTPVQEVTTLTGDDARSLRIATFNVENLSPVGTTFSTNNGVEITTAEKYTKLANHIATNLDAPDILIIEEIQDNNGVTQDSVTDASQTWAQLVAAVNAATGKTYQWVDEAPTTSGDVGGAPGGNIRVGFLYDTSRVQLGNLAADATLAERRQYTDRIGDGVRDAGDLIAIDDTGLGINPADWTGTRRSIVGEFTFNGQTVYAVGSHLPSKGGSDDPYEIGQNNSAGTPANGDWALRNTLAQDVWAVQNRASGIDDAKVVSGGDFNEFWYNRPLEVLTGYANPDGTANAIGADYVNLMVQELDAAERFSYDFDGRSQALDTLIADQSLAAVASYDVVHINSGYNDRTGAVNPASSDHDPSLASFDFRSFSEELKGTDGNDAIQGFGGNDSIDGGAGTDTAIFADAWTAVTVSNGGATVATATEGTDILTSVEQLRFNGTNVAASAAVNDAPIGANDTATGVIENGNGSATGNVLTNDTDADLALGLGERLTVIGARTGTEPAGGTFATVGEAPIVIAGLYGNLTITADGAYSYALDNDRAATKALNSGQTVQDSFTYQVSDAHGLIDAAQLSVDVTGASSGYTLQLLHLSDGEAGLLASSTAKNLAALADAFEDQFVNSITLSGGDTYLPGPFMAAGTDPSLIPVINATTGSTISTAAGSTPAPGVVDTAIHNIIGVQASGIGNHEWDLGSNVYAATLTPGSGWVGAQYASISANLVLAPAGQPADPLNSRFTQTVGVNGLEEASSLKGRIAPSAVITEGGEKIGLVGVTTQILESISSPSGAEIAGFPYGPGANGEINDMALLAAQLQPVIDDLRNQGVNKIILMSHLQQIEFEKALAPLLQGVDIILAAGSNTRLGDADDDAVAFPGHDADFADTYPIVTAGADGKTTLIVNTDNEYTYLGRLVVDFDANGDIVLDSLTANQAINGAYASTDENVAEAWNTTVDNLESTAFADGTKGDKVRDLTDAVQNVIEVKDGNVYGYTNVYLEGERVQVRNQETNLGNLSADANADVARDALGLTADHAIVSIKNGGGIRAQIGTIVNNPDGTVTKVPPAVGGEVSQLDVENALRFDNKLMVFDTTAQGLLNILNSPNALAPNNGGFIQIGGVRFSYDPTKPAGSRVQDVVLINDNGQITAVIADNGVVNPNAPAIITAVALNFTANGGDGYLVKQNADNFRYLKTDGTLSAAVNETLDFTATTTIDAYVGSAANLLGEQQAFAEYMEERYGTPETAYNEADTGQALDTRIQNQSVRTDTVLQGEYLTLGTTGHDVLNGTAGSETLKGLDGNDRINGLDGDDILNGGAGADRMNGGEGIDTVTYADATGSIVASLATKRGFFGEAFGDRFSNIENLTGSAYDDVLSGDGKVNVIHGGAGDDIIEGNGGADSLYGDAGNDRFIVSGATAALFDGGEGFDTVVADDDNIAFNWNPANFVNVEAISGDGYANVSILGAAGSDDVIDLSNLVLTDIAIVDGRSGNDRITGSAGADRLSGSGGNDILNGGGGDDQIDGGAGVDQLTGGTGADRFLFAKGDTGKTSATADTILDFISGQDRIDLSAIDANSVNGTATNEAFSFIGTGAFTRTAGELRYDVVDDTAYVSGDWNGDGKADFMIGLTNVSSVTSLDFIL